MLSVSGPWERLLRGGLFWVAWSGFRLVCSESAPYLDLGQGGKYGTGMELAFGIGIGLDDMKTTLVLYMNCIHLELLIDCQWNCYFDWEGEQGRYRES